MEKKLRVLVNARSFQLECGRGLYEGLFVPVLSCGSETSVWVKNERSGIRDVQIENLRSFFGY